MMLNLSPPRRNLLVVLALLVVLNVVDAIVTNFLVKTEAGTEGNPFLMVWAGESTFFILKFFGALLAAFVLWDIHRRYPALAFWTATFFTLVYLGITAWNLSIVLRI